MYSEKIRFFFDDLAIYGVLIMIISGKRGGAVGAR